MRNTQSWSIYRLFVVVIAFLSGAIAGERWGWLGLGRGHRVGVIEGQQRQGRKVAGGFWCHLCR
jgi:hypothetical protein